MTLHKAWMNANARAQRSESFARARGRRRGVTLWSDGGTPLSVRLSATFAEAMRTHGFAEAMESHWSHTVRSIAEGDACVLHCVPHCVLQRIAPRARAVIDACNFPATGVPLDRLAHARKVEFAEADPTRRESNRTR